MIDDQPQARAAVGVALAAAPHALLLAWIVLLLVTSDGASRSYIGFVGVLEFFLMPAGLLAALAARFLRPVRHWALPVAATTVGGGLLVIVVAIVIAGVTGS